MTLSQKKLLIRFILGVFFFTLGVTCDAQEHSAKSSDSNPPKNVKKTPEEKEMAELGVEEAKDTFIKHAALTFPLFQDDKVVKYIVINPSFETFTDEQAKESKRNIRRLRDGIISDLWIYLDLFWSPDKPLNFDQMKEIVLRTHHRILGKETVKNLYFASQYYGNAASQ